MPAAKSTEKPKRVRGKSTRFVATIGDAPDFMYSAGNGLWSDGLPKAKKYRTEEEAVASGPKGTVARAVKATWALVGGAK